MRYTAKRSCLFYLSVLQGVQPYAADEKMLTPLFFGVPQTKFNNRTFGSWVHEMYYDAMKEIQNCKFFSILALNHSMMLSLFLCVICMFFSSNSIAQVRQLAEIMPQFEGSTDGLKKWLSDNMSYPQEAIQKKEEGRVVVKFVITEDGIVTQPKVTRGVSPSLDAEALRLVSQMPKWIPASQDGQPCSVEYSLPIRFKLPELSQNAERTFAPEDTSVKPAMNRNIRTKLPHSIVEKTKEMNGTDKQEDTLYSGIYKVTDKKGEQVFFKLSTSANGDRTVRIKYVFKNGKTPNNNGIEYSYWGKWNVEELGGKKVLSLKKDKEKEILKPLWISFYGIGAMEEHSIVYMRFLNKTNIILFINDDDKTSLGMLKISETPENSVADETKEKQIILQNKQKVQQQRIEKANNIAEGKRKAPGEYKIKDKIKTVFLKLDTDGKVYFKYNGTCLGKQYQNDSYVYWGTWQIENSAIEGNKIKMEQDMRNFQRWLHIYFPCSGLIEMMQQYSSLVIFMKDGKIYGGRCNTPLQTVKIQ